MESPDKMEAWGWDARWAGVAKAAGTVLGGGSVDPALHPARVTGHERAAWWVEHQQGGGPARVLPSAGLPFTPVVGDWVLVAPGPEAADPWSIKAVLPRRARISRGAAGTGATEQVLAANVDRIWIVHGLDRPLNPRALERYLAVAWESGATPEVVLTKADVAEDLPGAVAGVAAVAVGVQTWVVGVADAESVDRLRGSLGMGSTVVLLGPSGVGKSTLLNALAGAELAATGAVREYDHKGRHTTTRRQLFPLEGGALLLDTPGIRELRIWALDEGLERAFPEIDALAAMCRFANCRHETEPGCAVLEAVEAGALDPARMASYQKLQAEAAFQARKADPRARAEHEAEIKSIMKSFRLHPKYKDR
jgi:ribosome biogenesis GTPase